MSSNMRYGRPEEEGGSSPKHVFDIKPIHQRNPAKLDSRIETN